MDFIELDAIENSLMQRHSSNLDKIISNLSDRKFKNLLLQRRWTSYAFTPLYDFAIDSMANEKTKQILRKIRNEEYPANIPSHREDLVHDLMTIGINLKNIVNTVQSEETFSVIAKEFNFLKIRETQELHDIKALAFLRFNLEILVSVEYGVFIKRLENLGLSKKNSKFYWPHYIHDMKRCPIGAGSHSGTHSDRLAQTLAEILDSGTKIQFCMKITEASYKLRSEVFNQFKR